MRVANLIVAMLFSLSAFSEAQCIPVRENHRAEELIRNIDNVDLKVAEKLKRFIDARIENQDACFKLAVRRKDEPAMKNAAADVISKHDATMKELAEKKIKIEVRIAALEKAETQGSAPTVPRETISFKAPEAKDTKGLETKRGTEITADKIIVPRTRTQTPSFSELDSVQ